MDFSEPVGQHARPETDGAAATSPTLPKRRRGDTLAQVHPEGLTAAPAAKAAPAKPTALGAFQRSAPGRTTTSHEPGSAAAAPDPMEDR